MEQTKKIQISSGPIWKWTKTTKAQQFIQQAEEKESKPKVILPEFYQEYASVFDKETSEWMPSQKSWDHAIDLKEDFIPQNTEI